MRVENILYKDKNKYVNFQEIHQKTPSTAQLIVRILWPVVVELYSLHCSTAQLDMFVLYLAPEQPLFLKFTHMIQEEKVMINK